MSGEASNPIEASLRQALAANPADSGVMQRLAIVLFQSGRPDEAILLFRQAADVRPGSAEAHANLGAALASSKMLEPAADALNRAAAIQPDLPRLQFNLGNTLLQLGRYAQAADALGKAVQEQPDDIAAVHNCGTALRGAGRIVEAAQAYRRAAQLAPDLAAAFGNLCITLQELGQYEEAIAAGGRAVALEPGNAELHAALGHAFRGIPDNQRAAACYKQVILLRPLYAPGYFYLGNVHRDLYGLDAGVDLFRRAIELDPNYADAYRNLGSTLRDQGKLDEAIETFRRGGQVGNSASIAGNLLYTLHFHPKYDARMIHDEAVKWNEQYVAEIENASMGPIVDPAPDRRLRIGYVSPDFRDHPIGRFMLPLLSNHDRNEFEIYCYSDTQREDAMTQTLRSHTTAWRHTVGMNDEQLANQIRADHIDILIDLSLHARTGRLLAFARRPAPVQATYLAYAGTSGLRSMDFRISDPYLDPPGTDLSVYFEKTIRLPKTYWCYPGSDIAPPVVPTPALMNGYVTFGCLNLFAKNNALLLIHWARSLPQNCRLILHAHEGSHRDEVRKIFGSFGRADSVSFVSVQPMAQYFAEYNNIDIALDPWPYAGGTTTCDALWMGVPVVSATGDLAVSRGGVSILSNLGLPELAAESVGISTVVASKLADDIPKLNALRLSMRDRMKASPIMDAPGFTRDFEAALRTMWQTKMSHSK